MEFTYIAYRGLLSLLRQGGYAFTDYHDYQAHPRCVILRHDIDNSLPQALRLAELEAEEGVKSTWFVLLRTDFYNPASAASQQALRRIRSLGHELGLHFDEMAYSSERGIGTYASSSTEELIRHEASILADICGCPITAVSMHRPSKATLEADLRIPGMVNSYGQTFFHDFKYLSDSRRRWREPVEDIIRGGEYDRLHILTHAFWYHEQSEDIAESVGGFIRSANAERYAQMMENITDLPSILTPQLTQEQQLHMRHFHTLESARLLLRPLREADAEAMFAYTSQPESFRFLRRDPHRSVQEDLEFIQRAEEGYRTHKEFIWGIEEKESGALVGTCRLFGLSAQDGRGEVSYLMHQTYRRRGYTSEAISRVIRYAFDEIGLHRVQAHCVSGNIGSERVMQKCGMQLEGEQRESVCFHGRYENIKTYSIIREERS